MCRPQACFLLKQTQLVPIGANAPRAFSSYPRVTPSMWQRWGQQDKQKMGLDFSLLKHICLKNHLDMRTEKSLSTTSWNSLLRDLSEGVWSMDSDPEVAPLSSSISSTRALRSLSRAALSRGWLPSKSVDSISKTCMNGMLRTPPTCKWNESIRGAKRETVCDIDLDGVLHFLFWPPP